MLSVVFGQAVAGLPHAAGRCRPEDLYAKRWSAPLQGRVRILALLGDRLDFDAQNRAIGERLPERIERRFVACRWGSPLRLNERLRLRLNSAQPTWRKR